MFDFTFEKLDGDTRGAIPMFSGYGRLSLSVNDREIWRDDRGDTKMGILEYWDSLLDHLARCWRYLRIEEPYPLRFNPESPLGFLEDAMAELRKMGLSENAFIEEEVKIFAFSDRHNLAAGMQDLFLPPLFILREGNDMRIVTEMEDVRLPFGQVIGQLEALGSAIARSIHPQSPRGCMILDAWEQRDHTLPVRDALAVLIGVPPSLIDAIAANDDLSEAFGYTVWDSPSPRVVAARMTQHCLEPYEIRMVMDKLAKARLGQTSGVFARLRCGASTRLASLAGELHYRQGYELAKWLRSTLNVSAGQTIEPGQWLQDWGVTVEFSEEFPDGIDAVAIWQDDRAGVVIHRRGANTAVRRRERASLAHEIAHLLLDTDHALPSVEILGGRMPVLAEKRAKAFAAELLLPRSQVEESLSDPLGSESIAQAIDRLTDQFNVSRQLTGHQMENLLKDTGKLTFPVKKWIDRAVD
ncbi:MAG: ImmA/IrrE family metallo-endopeptidase [Magnetococcus sp. MYC-9]